MNISDFISNVNLHVPTIEQIIEKRKSRGVQIDIFEAEKMQERYRLNYYPADTTMGELDNLIYNTNIVSIGIGSLNFHPEIFLEDGVYRCFASYNDYYELCHCLTDQKIVLLERNTLVINEIIAKSLDQLFHFLCLYNNYDRNIIFKVPLENLFVEKLKALESGGFSRKFIKLLMPEFQ